MATTKRVAKGAISSALSTAPVNATQFEAKDLPAPITIIEKAIKAETETDSASAPVSVGAMTFDPLDFICTRVNTEEARHSILRSMAWYVDMALLGEIKALYFKMFADLREAGEIESYSEFVRAMDVQDEREAALVSQGFAQGSGVNAIRTLTLLRSDWHERAFSNKTNYIMPSVPALILAEKPQVPDALSKVKLKDLALDLSDGDEQEAATLYADLLAREEAVANDRHLSAIERQRSLIGIFEFVSNTNTVDEAEFTDLPTTLRARIVTGMIKSTSTALVQLATNRKVSVLEYAAARKELKNVAPQLEVLLLTRLCDDDAVSAPADGDDDAGSNWQAASEMKSVMRQGIASSREH